MTRGGLRVRLPEPTHPQPCSDSEDVAVALQLRVFFEEFDVHGTPPSGKQLRESQVAKLS